MGMPIDLVSMVFMIYQSGLGLFDSGCDSYKCVVDSIVGVSDICFPAPTSVMNTP